VEHPRQTTARTCRVITANTSRESLREQPTACCPDVAADADGEDETGGAGPAEESGAGASGSADGDSRFREGL
jgi:hypothetical protein